MSRVRIFAVIILSSANLILYEMTHDIFSSAAPLLLLVCVEYLGVFIAVIADLVSGVCKSQSAGVKCTSWGLRRTVDKIARYYVALFSLTLIDGMYVMAAIVLAKIGFLSLPAFPFLSTFGSIGLAMIEVKSILERSDEKGDLSLAATLLKDLLSRLPRK